MQHHRAADPVKLDELSATIEETNADATVNVGSDGRDRDTATLEAGKEHIEAIRNIVVYFLFMIVFGMDTASGLRDDRKFYFAENLKQQFIGVEMQQQFSPTWGKNFQDVATVEEYYHW
jgi:hypothetical protein